MRREMSSFILHNYVIFYGVNQCYSCDYKKESQMQYISNIFLILHTSFRSFVKRNCVSKEIRMLLELSFPLNIFFCDTA
jgi:hypothetical protein